MEAGPLTALKEGEQVALLSKPNFLKRQYGNSESPGKEDMQLEILNEALRKPNFPKIVIAQKNHSS